MKKMETYLFKILKVLDDSGVANLNTLCHGDAKPNNFMFRKIDIDFGDTEDEELQGFKCEGVESMLIDWQMGFLGSVCNDLMWSMYPFFEVNNHDKELYEFAFRHYYDELKNVLDTFSSNLSSFGLPEEFGEFRSLIRRGFVLEFLIVTVLRPVLNITKPDEVLKWHEKMLKYDQMKAKGGIHAMLARNKPKLPPQENVFDNPRYMEFLQFYFQIATALGAFQELGLIYFELMKDGLFKVRNICNKNVSCGPLFKLKWLCHVCNHFNLEIFKDTTTPMVFKKKPKVFSKDWFKKILSFSCVSAEEADSQNEILNKNDDDDDVNEAVWSTKATDTMKAKNDEENEIENTEQNSINVEDTEQVENMSICESILLEIKETPAPEVKDEEIERTPTPDPLKRLAAQLQGQLSGYKEDFNKFSNLMEENKPAEDTEYLQPEENKKTDTVSNNSGRKLSTEEERALVQTMSNEDAWSHVVAQVYEVCRKCSANCYLRF